MCHRHGKLDAPSTWDAGEDGAPQTQDAVQEGAPVRVHGEPLVVPEHEEASSIGGQVQG
jgi:hypothetical protein